MTSPNDIEPVLSIDPDAAHFLITGGKSEHMLVNTGEKRIAVKVSFNFEEFSRNEKKIFFYIFSHNIHFIWDFKRKVR